MTDNESIIIINGRRIRYSNIYIDIDQLNFYPKNPRISTILEEHGSNVTNDLIDSKLWDRDETHELFKSIKRDGGLLNPITVYKNEVLEGNTRLCCYRHLYCENKDEKWKKISCNVILDELGNNDVYRLLCIEHIEGKTDWEPYEKANLYCKMNDEEKMNYEQIADLVGESQPTVSKRIRAYKMMVENGIIDKNKYSHFEQMVGNKGIQDLIKIEPKIEEQIIEAVKEDRIPTAQDIRKIPDVCKHKEAKKRFLQGKQGIDQVYIDLKAKAPMTDSPFMKDVEEMIVKTIKLNREEREGLKANNRDRSKVEQLTKELVKLCRELDVQIHIPKSLQKNS